MKTIIIIPARMDSKRLPGKPLLMADGQALLHWTYAQAKRTKADHIVVTSSDREVGSYCFDNGITFFPSSEKHENGTSRCWEIVERMKVGAARVVCWQVDEPCVDPEDVDQLLSMKTSSIGTLVSEKGFDSSDPNVVKVICSFEKCHWFTRHPIPSAFGHVGIYSFLPGILYSAAQLTQTEFSQEESLEQLTWLENGNLIVPYNTTGDRMPLGINTQKDWIDFRDFIIL